MDDALYRRVSNLQVIPMMPEFKKAQEESLEVLLEDWRNGLTPGTVRTRLHHLKFQQIQR
jgi:hypothetical protein